MSYVIAAVILIIASVMSYPLLRRGIPWRIVMIAPASAVFVAGILSLVSSGHLQRTQVLLLVGLVVSFYVGMVLSWRVVGDKFRSYGARW